MKVGDLYREADVEGPSASHDVRVLTPLAGGGVSYSKASGGDDLQLVNEYLSWSIYRAFGVGVSDHAALMLNDAGQVRLITKQVPGTQIEGPAELHNSNFSDGFYVDAFLGNWDVVGNIPRFNVFLDRRTSYRIDTGGMDFRALGGRKEGRFGERVDELTTFAGIRGAPTQSTASFAYCVMDSSDWSKATKVFQSTSWEALAPVFTGIVAHVEALGKQELTSRATSYIEAMRGLLRARYMDIERSWEEYEAQRAEIRLSGSRISLT